MVRHDIRLRNTLAAARLRQAPDGTRGTRGGEGLCIAGKAVASGWRVEGEGYAVAYALAADNLALGRTVIADCVNPWPLTRAAWRAVAERSGVRAVEIEVVCSDPAEHRRRVEQRQPDIDGQQLPSWQDVVERDYRPWDDPRLVLDTARSGIAECVQAIASRLSS